MVGIGCALPDVWVRARVRSIALARTQIHVSCAVGVCISFCQQRAPEIGYPGPETDYPGPEVEYPGPESDYPGPEVDYPGPESDYPGLNSFLVSPPATYAFPCVGKVWARSASEYD